MRTHAKVRRALAGLAAMLLLSVIALLATVGPATAVGPVFTRIQSADPNNNFRCLQPENESQEEFAPIVQVTCTQTGNRAFAQSWQRIDLGSNRFRFQNQLSGFCIDAFDGAFNGARLLQGTCVPISNEEFRTSATPPATVSIQSRVGFRDTGFCIDAPGVFPREGRAVQLFQCNGSDAQKWFHGFRTG
jgi:hypothetical protein